MTRTRGYRNVMTMELTQPRRWRGRFESVRGWAGLALLWSFLVSPLLVWRASGTAHVGTDWLFVFNVVTTALWVGLLQFTTRRPLHMHLALLPLYLTTAADLFLLNAFQSRLSSSYFATLLTDYDDTTDFFLTYGQQVFWVALVSVAVCAIGLWSVRRLEIRRHPRLAMLCALGLMAVYGFAVQREHFQGDSYSQAVLDVLPHDFSAPVGAVAQAAIAVHLLAVNHQLRGGRAAFTFHAWYAPATGRRIFILVIGESSRVENWQLFGYRRATTPLMCEQPGIIALANVLTTAPSTSVAVPSLLSLAPITKWKEILGHKSIVTVFKEAGFDTYWISAQQVDTFGGSIPEIAAEARYRRYYDQGFDQQLLSDLQRILGSAGANARMFIVLHTKGSHFEYSRRYPPAFARFTTKNPTRRQKLTDAYDNSILYTDFILHAVISALRATDGVTAMMYASDHGENLLDDSRQLLGHGLGTDYDLHLAALVWLSEQYRIENPRKAAELQAHAGAQISISNLPHTLLGLAGVQADGLDETLDLSSPRFTVHPRYYLLRGSLSRAPPAPR